MNRRPLTGVRVVFRCDGSQDIGFGHVARCLVLAEEMRNAGATDILFVTRSLHAAVISRIRSAGYNCATLPGNISESNDLTATLNCCRRENCLLVTDSHDFSESYYAALHNAGIRTISFDDYAAVAYASDIVINPNIGADRFTYHTWQDTQVLLGPDYLPLRDEFRKAAGQMKSTRDRVQSVVVSLGGMPEPAAASCVLLGLREWAIANGVVLTLIVGIQANPVVVEGLKACMPPGGSVTVDPPDLAALLYDADLAVVNGGMTAYEAASLGVPLIMTAVVDNQVAAVAGFAEAKAAVALPPVLDLAPAAVASAVETVAQDADLRATIGAAARRLIDGKGAERIVNAAVSLLPTAIQA